MKIKSEKLYFNESIFGKFFPQRKEHENLILIKKFSSYNKAQMISASSQMSRIGYKIIVPLFRKWFVWKFDCARVVPYYQRLIITEAYVEKQDWEEKRKIAIPKIIKSVFGSIYDYTDTGLRWSDRYEKVKIHGDEIIYTDSDLELMAKFRDKWNPEGWPVINTAEILKKWRDEGK